MEVLRRVQSTGIRKGMAKGSTPWLVLGLSAWTFRTLRRLAARDHQAGHDIVGNHDVTVLGTQTQPDTAAEDHVVADGHSVGEAAPAYQRA